jgi:hypothetical protein
MASGASARMLRGVATETIASRRGCRISPRRQPFIVSLSNDRRVAHVDSACVRGVAVASAVLVGDISNALDLCDSHRRLRERRP